MTCFLDYASACIIAATVAEIDFSFGIVWLTAVVLFLLNTNQPPPCV